MTIKCPHCGTLHSIKKATIEAEIPIYCLKCGKEMHHEGYPLKKAPHKPAQFSLLEETKK